MKERERIVAFGRWRLRKTGLWVVGEKPCRDVCSNDCRRPFVVSPLCSLERLVTVTDFNVWVQKCTSYTYAVYPWDRSGF